ncbi:MAG: hypothetical protein KatS3mg087_1214 [Patescibacteria group bacterium]|nr:MAG: hypothetical protein KatS3mg087_1214 [Patescibacteria group bacterium]
MPRPLTNRPIELFPIISTLKPKIWKSRLAYAKRYCNPRLTPWGWDFRGASNLDELHKILKSTCMVRYTTKQVLTTLPGKNRRVIVLDILNRDDYVEAEKNFLHWLKLNYPERYEKSIKAAALVQIGVLLRLAAKKKLKFAVDYINKFIEQNPKRRIVVYAIHKKCLAALKRRINAKSAIIDGSTPHNKRREIITAFRAGRLTVLIANILAAGVGINLQVSDTMFVLELPFKPGPLLQVEGRIHRLGQSMVSNINYLIAKNTIEEKLIKLIQSKEQTIATVLDGKNSADLNLLELLLKELYDQHSRSA